MEKGRNGSWLLCRTSPTRHHLPSHFDEHLQKRLFVLTPKTGKNHQLRVAMKSLGAPMRRRQPLRQPARRPHLPARLPAGMVRRAHPANS